ncbi:hypothetical protein K438DRAFT_1972302 [Mycena galopus ATCC 62051]|nr:hypothetical protein K438DRAFT_1972302 [Mycena galopus ATCC 62051]
MFESTPRADGGEVVESRNHYDLSTSNTRSLAVLQREYHMQPLPPSTTDEHAPRRAQRPACQPPAYTSSIMMAHRRIDAILPKPLTPGDRPPPLKPIPGWTDSSQAWRAPTYSFALPPQTRADDLDPNRAAYTSFHASPHRSAQSGVTASSASGSCAPSSPTTSASGGAATSSSLNSEMLSSFEDSVSRRVSLSPPTPPPQPPSARAPPRASPAPTSSPMYSFAPPPLRKPPSPPSRPAPHSRGAQTIWRRHAQRVQFDGAVEGWAGENTERVLVGWYEMLEERGEVWEEGFMRGQRTEADFLDTMRRFLEFWDRRSNPSVKYE